MFLLLYFTVTVEPISALPVTFVALSFTSFTFGVPGAVLSLTVTFAAFPVLPALSFAETYNAEPAFFLLILMEKFPLLSAFAVPMFLLLCFTVTVEPISALPVTEVALSLTSFTFGASGAVLSRTVTAAALLSRFAKSVAVTESLVPAFCLLIFTLKFPLLSVLPEPITFLALFLIEIFMSACD